VSRKRELEALGFSADVGAAIVQSVGKPPVCRDYGDRPGCLGTPDDRFTMRFDDIGHPPIHWCAACGPEAQAMNTALERALATRGPEFQAELSDAIDAAEAKRKDGAS